MLPGSVPPNFHAGSILVGLASGNVPMFTSFPRLPRKATGSREWFCDFSGHGCMRCDLRSQQVLTSCPCFQGSSFPSWLVDTSFVMMCKKGIIWMFTFREHARTLSKDNFADASSEGKPCCITFRSLRLHSCCATRHRWLDGLKAGTLNSKGYIIYIGLAFQGDQGFGQGVNVWQLSAAFFVVCLLSFRPCLCVAPLMGIAFPEKNTSTGQNYLTYFSPRMVKGVFQGSQKFPQSRH